MWKFGQLWAGTESSYELALTAAASALALQQSGKEPPVSELLSIEGSVGVVTVEGSLIPGEAGFLSYFGLTGYGDIRNAMVEAANHPEVKSILLSINSGGGAVDGCADCASLVAAVGDIKPVLTYADGAFGSAAYWIGSQAQAILIGPTTQAGSIGVILKHSEMSKARAEMGITDTVIRSGEYKQLANNLEPLSKEGKAQLQQMSDDILAVFLGQVASARGMSASAVDSKMGKGREFIGARAVSVGLADGISTYEGALSASKAMQVVDNTNGPRQNARSPGADMKKILNAEQIAAIASGAVIEASAAQETAETTATDAAAAAEVAAAAAASGDKDKTQEATAVAAAAAATAAEASIAAGDAAGKAVTAESELVKFLRTELSSAQATNTANAIQIAQLTTEATMMRETQPKLLEIARGAVGKMKVAMGGTAASASAMSAAEVITAHAETSALFNEKFIIGGAAAGAAADAGEKKAAAAPNVHSIFSTVARAGSK